MKKPVEKSPTAAPEPLRLKIGGVERVFDIENPELPEWVDKRALKSGGFPYDKKLKKEDYETTLENLQIELVKMLSWMLTEGQRALVVFEGLTRQLGLQTHLAQHMQLVLIDLE